jgi:hypothetical protein
MKVSIASQETLHYCTALVSQPSTEVFEFDLVDKSAPALDRLEAIVEAMVVTPEHNIVAAIMLFEAPAASPATA